MEIVLLSLTFFILIVAGSSTYFAIKGNHRLYWVSAVSIYLFSFLTSFTIGLLTVGLSFVSLVLAIGYSFDWIKGKMNLVTFLGIGILIGFLMIYYVRDDLFPF